MLITIEEFRRRVASDSAALVSRLQEETGRYGSEEAQAWESSLTQAKPRVSSPILSAAAFVFRQPGEPSVGVSIARCFFMGRCRVAWPLRVRSSCGDP